MPCGTLTQEMEALLAPLVADRVVWDLGAGDLVYAHRLLALGASTVVAVDKELHGINSVWDTRIHILGTSFDRLVPPARIEVAFLSWPQNYPMPALEHLLTRADIVIYLGCNTGGSACGTPRLLTRLMTRELLGHVPLRRNTLLVYGEPRKRSGPMTGEEFAALSQTLLTFEEAERAALEHSSHWT